MTWMDAGAPDGSSPAADRPLDLRDAIDRLGQAVGASFLTGSTAWLGEVKAVLPDVERALQRHVDEVEHLRGPAGSGVSPELRLLRSLHQSLAETVTQLSAELAVVMPGDRFRATSIRDRSLEALRLAAMHHRCEARSPAGDAR